MQFKRARTTAEVARDVAIAMPDASQEEQEAEQAARIEKLKIGGLLLEQWNLDDVGADLRWCGISGSPTKVHRVQSIVLTKKGYAEVPPTEEGVRGLIHELIVEHTWG